MKELATIKQIIKELKPELEKKFHVSSIGIFGSVVRNDFSENSDVDIIVDFSQPIGIEFIDLADLLEEKFYKQVDLVSKKGIKPLYFSKTLRT
jgi:predicted nucleotidyltransferase